MLRHPDPAFWRTPALIEYVAAASPSLALQLLKQAADWLAREFVKDPLAHWNDLYRMVMRLGYGPVFLRGGRRPPRESGPALRAFTRALDIEAVARTLSQPNHLWGHYNFDQCVSFLSECDPPTLFAALDRVDLGLFEDAPRLYSSDQRTALYVALHLNDRGRPRSTECSIDLNRVSMHWIHLYLTWRPISQSAPCGEGFQWIWS